MARKRAKKRAQAGAVNGSALNAATKKPPSNGPKSMVIRVGASDVGSSVSQLVKDIRSMMEPDTAARLKVILQIRGSHKKVLTLFLGAKVQ